MYATRVHLAQRRPHHYLPLQVLIGQCVVLVLIVGLSWGLGRHDAMLSALLGSVLSLVPTLYFACRFVRPHGSRQAKQQVSNLYRAQAGKFTVTLVLFVIVFVNMPPANPVLFFSAYAVTALLPQLFCWCIEAYITPLMNLRRTHGRT